MAALTNDFYPYTLRIYEYRTDIPGENKEESERGTIWKKESRC